MSSTIVREPEWDQESRDLITAYLSYDSQVCECGQYRPRSTDPRAESTYRGADRIRFQGESIRCFACEALEVEQNKFKDDTPTRARKHLVREV